MNQYMSRYKILSSSIYSLAQALYALTTWGTMSVRAVTISRWRSMRWWSSPNCSSNSCICSLIISFIRESSVSRCSLFLDWWSDVVVSVTSNEIRLEPVVVDVVKDGLFAPRFI